MNEKTVLITGASSGIGAEFAKIFAKKRFNLVLVARREELLEQIKGELSINPIDITTISINLALPNAAEKLFEKITQFNLNIDILVNNAGVGGQGYFYKRRWQDEFNMMQLNMVALSQLCHLFIPSMIERGYGKILNVASSAGLLAGGPLQSTYFATKSFVISFSKGISEELVGTGVTVTALCPGATNTEFEKTAGLEGTALFSGKLYSPELVAEDGFHALMQEKRIKKTGLSFLNRINLALAPLVPDSLTLRMIKKMQTKNETTI